MEVAHAFPGRAGGRTTRRGGVENHRYQRDLAETLRADLGLEGAVLWCQEQGWEGVIRQLLAKRRDA